jgi:hypothetical protein
VLIKMNEIRKKYLVTPFFVDQLSFNLSSFRHYYAFIRSEKINKIAIGINDSIAKMTSVGIKSLQGKPNTPRCLYCEL